MTYHYDPAGHLADLGNDHLDLGSSEGVDDAHCLDFLTAMGKGHPDGRRVLCGSGEGSATQRGEEGSGTC